MIEFRDAAPRGRLKQAKGVPRGLRQCPGYALGFEQLRQLPARVEHAGFDGIAADADDLGNLLHRFLMIVDQIDYLPMLPGEPPQALAQDFPTMLDLKGDFRRIRRIAELRALLVG